MHGTGHARTSALAAALGALVLASGCGGGEPGAGAGGERGPGEPSSEAESEETSGLLPIGVGEARVTGLVVLEGRQGRFVPCEGGAEYRVDGPAMFDLLGLHRELLGEMESSEAIFVDVLAEVEAPAGRGSRWAGTLHVLEMHRAAFEGWSCDDPAEGVVAEARGNEPFWRLAILVDSTRFVTPEGARSWEVAGPPSPSPEGWRFTGTTDTGVPFMLSLGIGGCFDTMSGAWSRLDARLVVDEEEWWGCGWLGAAGGP